MCQTKQKSDMQIKKMPTTADERGFRPQYFIGMAVRIMCASSVAEYLNLTSYLVILRFRIISELLILYMFQSSVLLVVID